MRFVPRLARALAPLATLLALGGRTARAQSADARSIAPGVAVAERHRASADELAVLVSHLSADARKRVVGVYVAFDTSMTDASSLVACDDDGDYTIVLSDGMLELVDHAALAMAVDEVFGTRKLEAYAEILGKTPAGSRLAPPPPGFFERGQATDPRVTSLARVRVREAIAGLVAHELAHVVEGDLVCPKPTATHERGDEVWTPEEQRQALQGAPGVYTSARVLAADAAATANLLDSGRSEQGAAMLLELFARWGRALAPAGAPLYLRIHGPTELREQVVRAGANQWRLLKAAGPRGK